MVHTFTCYLLIVILSTMSSSGNMSGLLSCLLSSFFSYLYYVSFLSARLLSPFILLCLLFCLFYFCFRLHSLIKFEVMWLITLFGNNDAWCIWLTPVLIDLGLSFCLSNHFINVLLGLICISVLSAPCIVISQYLSLVQWVIYYKSMTFIMLSMKSS